MIWTDISYLNRGSDLQRDAFQLLVELDLLSVLAEVDPIVVGDFALGLEHPGSALEIACSTRDAENLASVIEATYGELDGFTLTCGSQYDESTTEAEFEYHRITVRIVAQAVTSEEQAHYRESAGGAALLRAGGDEAQQAVRQLMAAGYGAQAALGRYFCLDGEAHVALARLADASRAEVDETVIQARVLRRSFADPIDLVTSPN